jgi:hypothetical protein
MVLIISGISTRKGMLRFRPFSNEATLPQCMKSEERSATPLYLEDANEFYCYGN